MQLHYKGQCWCDCSVDEVLMRCHGKDEYWHGFSANKMLMWFHGEEECWRSLGVNEVLSWLYVEKASLEKTSANIASVVKVMVMFQCKCKSWCSFMIRTIGMAALQRQVWNTFMQKQVLA